MDVTRRSLSRIVLAAAAAAQVGVAQNTTPDNPDLQSARELLQKNLQLIAKVKLPMATEPAFHFKA